MNKSRMRTEVWERHLSLGFGSGVMVEYCVLHAVVATG